MSRKTLLIVTLLVAITAVLVAQQPMERIDLNVIHKIKAAETATGGRGAAGGGAGRGGRGTPPPIMETLFNLTDHYGPRLTNSPQFRAAGDWAVKQLNDWGLSNVHLEKWATAPPPARPMKMRPVQAAGAPPSPVGNSRSMRARWWNQVICPSSATRRLGAAAPTAR